MAVALLTRYGYPKVPGDQPESIIDVSGPPVYVPMIPGSPGPPIVPPTGGQLLHANDFGLQSLAFVFGMASTDGKYFPLIVPLLIEPLPNPPLPTQLPDGSFATFILVWMNVTGGGQATGDLTQSTIRLFARGW